VTTKEWETRESRELPVRPKTGKSKVKPKRNSVLLRDDATKRDDAPHRFRHRREGDPASKQGQERTAQLAKNGVMCARCVLPYECSYCIHVDCVVTNSVLRECHSETVVCAESQVFGKVRRRMCTRTTEGAGQLRDCDCDCKIRWVGTGSRYRTVIICRAGAAGTGIPEPVI
jgi:hypothetical protein